MKKNIIIITVILMCGILSAAVLSGDTVLMKEYTKYNPVITVDKTEQVKIDGSVYNITYVPSVKCICEVKTGCLLKECIEVKLK